MYSNRIKSATLHVCEWSIVIHRCNTKLTPSTDMLSMVQSSIGAGQDPSQTLSRLMDWAEAREVSRLRRPRRSPKVSLRRLRSRADSRLPWRHLLLMTRTALRPGRRSKHLVLMLHVKLYSTLGLNGRRSWKFPIEPNQSQYRLLPRRPFPMIRLIGQIQP